MAASWAGLHITNKYVNLFTINVLKCLLAMLDFNKQTYTFYHTFCCNLYVKNNAQYHFADFQFQKLNLSVKMESLFRGEMNAVYSMFESRC
jgi:hypothetical protein